MLPSAAVASAASAASGAARAAAARRSLAIMSAPCCSRLLVGPSDPPPGGGGPAPRPAAVAATSAPAPRYFSSAPPPPRSPRKIDVDASAEGGSGGGIGGGSSDTPPPHPQDFVKVRLEPGEWDEEKTDPIYRPPWKSRAKIMSAEDFANRPKAGFGEEFASLHDAMAVLTWLSQADRDAVYSTYLDLMTTMAANDRGATSHEYAMRVIGQKFNITARRAAAIVQLQHEEDRRRKEEPDRQIHYKVQEYVDAKIRENIRECYEIYGEEPPREGEFVEDPTGVSGYGDPDRRVGATVAAEDLFDVDDLVERTIVREREEAQLSIDSHVYAEDVDESELDVKVSGECLRLIQVKNAATEAASEAEGAADNVGARLRRPDDQAPLPDNGRGVGGIWAAKARAAAGEPSSDGNEDGGDGGAGEGSPPTPTNNAQRRPRWKFVAKAINTRDEKAEYNKKSRSRRKKRAARNGMGVHRDDDVRNTLVEHDGILRPATAEEVSNVNWKPARDPQEFTYRGVKRAWIAHRNRGEKGAWGKVERDLEKEKAEEEEEEVEAAAEDSAGMAEEGAAEGGTGEGGADGENTNEEERSDDGEGEVGTEDAAAAAEEADSGKKDE